MQARNCLLILLTAVALAQRAEGRASCTTKDLPPGLTVCRPAVEREERDCGFALWCSVKHVFDYVLGSEPPFDRTIAFLVGIEDYENEGDFEDLPFVRKDISELRDVLLDVGFDEVYTLDGAIASGPLIDEYIKARFSKLLEPKDRFLFYFSGHGADAGGHTGYMLFRRAEKDKFYGDDVLAVKRVEEWIGHLKAKHVLFILDSCSAGLGREPPQSKSESENLASLSAALSGSGSRALMTAGTAGQKTYGDEKNGSYFTRAIITKLREGALDGYFLITEELNAAAIKAAANVEVQTGKRFKPRLWPLPSEPHQDGTFVFLNLNRSATARKVELDQTKAKGSGDDARARALRDRAVAIRSSNPLLYLHLMEKARRSARDPDLVESLQREQSSELASYRLRAIFEHDGPIRSAAFDSQGTRVLTWGDDGTARLWDVAAGAPIGEFMRHTAPIVEAVFDGQGERILTWAEDLNVGVWRAGPQDQAGSMVAMLQHDAAPRRARLCRQNSRLLTWTEDRTLLLWKVASGKPLRTIPWAGSADLLEEDTRLLVQVAEPGAALPTAVLLDTETGQVVRELPGSHVWATVPERGRFLTQETAGDWTQRQHVRRADTGEVLGEAIRHDGASYAWLDRERRRLIAWTEEGVASLWSLESGERLAEFEHPGSEELVAATGGRNVVVTADPLSLYFWAIDQEGHLMASAPIRAESEGADLTELRELFLDPTEQIVGVLTTEAVALWQLPAGTQHRLIEHEEGEITGARFADPDGATILTLSKDGTVRLWSVADGKELARFAHRGAVWGAELDPRQERLFSWTSSLARVWDAQTGSPVTPWLEEGRISWAAFSADRSVVYAGEILAPASQIWDAATGARIEVPLQGAEASRLSPDGSRLLAWYEDGTARLWALGGGLEEVRLQLEGEARGAKLDPRHRSIIAWSEGTAGLWDEQTGKPQAVFRYCGGGAIASAELVEEGTQLLLRLATGASWRGRLEGEVPEPRQEAMEQDGCGAVQTQYETRTAQCDFENPVRSCRTESYTSPFKQQTYYRIVRAEHYIRATDPTGSRSLIDLGEGVLQVRGPVVGEYPWPAIGPQIQFPSLAAADFSHAGDRLLLLNEQGDASVIDVGTGRQVGSTMRHGAANILMGGFSRDDTRILTHSWVEVAGVRAEVVASLWDAATGSLVNSFPGASDAWFTEDGTRVIISKWPAGPEVRDAARGALIAPRRAVPRSAGATRRFTAAAFGAIGPAETRLLTCSNGGETELWDAVRGDKLATLKLACERSGTEVTFSPDDQYVLTSSLDALGPPTVRLWNGGTGEAIGTSRKARMDGAAFSVEARRLLTWDVDRLTTWNLATGKADVSGDKYPGLIRGALISSSGTLALVWGTTGPAEAPEGYEARIWNLETGRSLGPPMVFGAEVLGGRFEAEESRVLAWSADGTVRLWEVPGSRGSSDLSAQCPIEVYTGRRLDENEVLRAVSAAEWRAAASFCGDPNPRPAND